MSAWDDGMNEHDQLRELVVENARLRADAEAQAGHETPKYTPTRTRRFMLEISVDPDETGPEDDSRMADELLDFLGNVEDLPSWVFSIDGVDPAR